MMYQYPSTGAVIEWFQPQLSFGREARIVFIIGSSIAYKLALIKIIKNGLSSAFHLSEWSLLYYYRFISLYYNQVVIIGKFSILRHPLVRILIPPFTGFLFYGGWAFVVNIGYGQMLALKAAITQGGYSFTITLVLALMIEWLFLRTKQWPFRLYFIGVIACSLLYVTSWSLNYLAGTPNILLTILPGAVVSTIYTIIYIIGLNKLDKRGDA